MGGEAPYPRSIGDSPDEVNSTAPSRFIAVIAINIAVVVALGQNMPNIFLLIRKHRHVEDWTRFFVMQEVELHRCLTVGSEMDRLRILCILVKPPFHLISETFISQGFLRGWNCLHNRSEQCKATYSEQNSQVLIWPLNECSCINHFFSLQIQLVNYDLPLNSFKPCSWNRFTACARTSLKFSTRGVYWYSYWYWRAELRNHTNQFKFH